MIFTLLYVLHSVGQYVMDKLKETIAKDDDDNEESVLANIGYGQNSGRRNSASSEEEEKIKFTPTASVQRYRAVERVLRRPEFDIQKVVEFGCANLRFVKNLKNVWSVRQAMFVDLDKQVLEDNKEKIEPRWDDYKCLRENPLQLSIYKGSVTHYNKLLENTDAVVCIELIEHLYIPDVERMTTNIFQNIQPKVVVITTPNKDFNVVFKMKDSEMRHWDHKFEWTRQEFNDWANGVVTKYPTYEVQTESIIDGPQGTQYLGGCSQMAVFTKINDQKNPVGVPPGDYTLIKQVSDFPYLTDELFCDYVLDVATKLRQEMEACGRQTTFIIDPEKRPTNKRIQYHPVDFYEFKSGIEHKISNARIKDFFQTMDIEIVWKPHIKEILLPFVEEGCDELIEENFVEEKKPMVEERWEEYDDKWNVEYTQMPPREIYSDDGYIDGEGDFDYVIADKPVQPIGSYPLGMDSPAVDGASPLHKSANLKRNLNETSLEKTDSLPSIYSFNLEKSAERTQTVEINPFLQPIKTPSPAQKKPRLKDLEGFSFRDAIEQYNERNGIPPFVLTSPKQSSTPKAFRLVKETESSNQSIRSDRSSDSKLEDFSDASEQKGKSSFYESAADETLQLDQLDSDLDQFDLDATFQS